MGCEDDAGGVATRLGFSHDDDRVGRVAGIEPISRAELGCIGERRIAREEFERMAEAAESRVEAGSIDVDIHGQTVAVGDVVRRAQFDRRPPTGDDLTRPVAQIDRLPSPAITPEAAWMVNSRRFLNPRIGRALVVVAVATTLVAGPVDSSSPTAPSQRAAVGAIQTSSAPGPAGRWLASERAAGDAVTTAAAFTLTLTPFKSGFSRPVFLTSPADGSGRMFVVQQGGKIKVINAGGTVLATPLLDITAKVSKGGEQGLLGLAFHPNFATNGKFYVNYTTLAGDTAITEYRLSPPSSNHVAPTGRRVLTIDQPYANHNGGDIAFGPDGYLYIATGDGGSAGDPGNRAQSLNSLLGKILRINVNGKTSTRGYLIPSSNPYVGKTGRDEIWSRGLRNPWRFSIDSATGSLWIGDVGQNRYEEVDRTARAGNPVGGKAKNYGWRVLEGRHCYRPSSGCSTTGKTMPLVEYRHDAANTSDDNCAVTGGYVYRGSASPALVGQYVFGDYCSGRIWTVSSTATSPATATVRLNTAHLISSFGIGPGKELYMLTLAGNIYRVGAS
jgi:glucose/arabinose dehydrogenase